LDSLVKEKVIEKMKKTDIVKKYENLIEKYNGLVNKYNDQLKEKTKLVGERDTLKFENQSYQRENRDLKLENGKLKDKYLELANEFSSFKKRVVKVLFVQIDRVKRFLRLNDVDHNKIKLLEDKRNEIVQDSLQRLEKPENQKREEMEMER